MNVLDLTPILLIATWVLFCCCEVHSLEDPVRKQSNLYHDCLKTCTADDENSEESQDSKVRKRCRQIYSFELSAHEHNFYNFSNRLLNVNLSDEIHCLPFKRRSLIDN